MALPQLTSSDAGASARAKINAAIAEAGRVAQVAADARASDDSLFTQIQFEAGVRQQNDDKIFNAFAGEIASVREGLEAEKAAIRSTLTDTVGALPISAPVLHRPGDAPQVFTQSLAGGEAATLPALPLSLLAVGDAGRVARLAGEAALSPRHMYAVEAGRRYAVTFVVQRRRNSPDPANDAVRCGLLFFGPSKQVFGPVLIRDIVDISTGSGRVVVRAVVARTAGAGVTVVAPAAAYYCKPYVQTFGPVVLNDVEVLGWEDITDAQAFAPDVSALEARLGTQEGLLAGPRLEALESEITAPAALRLPAFADIAGATVPASANSIQVQGNTAQGDGGAAIYRRVAQIPSHPAYATSRDGAIWELAEAVITPQMFGRQNWAGAFDAGRAYYNATGRGTYADYVRPAADFQRNHCTIAVPEINELFVDNVLAIQNLSKGYVNGVLCSGNAAINFLDRAGTERAAIGYSRNAALPPQGGYFPNLLYLECGNPFTSDGEITRFAVVVTVKAGSQYWGGNAISYEPISVDPRNGDLRLRTNEGAMTVHSDTFIGHIGENTRTFNVSMQAARARMRERRTANNFSIATNIANMGSDAAAAIAKDVGTDPAWEITFGTIDRLGIWRAPPTGGILREIFAIDPEEGVVFPGSVWSPRARLRERATAGQFALSANIANMDGARASLTKDVAGQSALELALNPGGDRVSLWRAPSDTTTLAEIFTLTGSGNLGSRQTNPLEAFHASRPAAATGLTRSGFRADVEGSFGAIFAGYLEQDVGAGAIIYTGGGGTFAEVLRIDQNKALRPGSDLAQSIGTAALRWASGFYQSLNLSGAIAPTGSADSSGAVGEVRLVGDTLYWKASGGWRRAVGAAF